LSKAGRGKALCWLALPLLICAVFCGLKGVALAVTAEEGLNYSVPGMQADARYPAAEVRRVEMDFRRGQRLGEEWMTAAEGACFGAITAGVFGFLDLPSGRANKREGITQ
jgi:hypothetical protein